jgi:hypothetical protein
MVWALYASATVGSLAALLGGSQRCSTGARIAESKYATQWSSVVKCSRTSRTRRSLDANVQ